jgi:N-acyl-D-aspartate/D-glutamate deacylase
MFDIIVRNGMVIDGTGQPAFAADVAIQDGRIVKVGEVVEQALTEIDAHGFVVAPGFIDVHTHYDAQVFWDPKLTPSSNHGVTTVIGGNCGFSIAPLSGRADDSRYLQEMLSRVEGMPLESLKQGVPWSWRSFGEYLDQIEGTLAVNAGFLVGHSALRRAVMGERAVGGDPSPDELEAMKALLAKSLAEGGLGFSTTMSPTHNDGNGAPVPSRHARTEEFVALARVAGQAEGTFLEMVADVGMKFSEQTLERMTAMSRAAGRSLNWNVLSPDARVPDLYETQLAASDYAAQRGGKVIALAAPKPISVVLSFAAGMILDAFPGWQDAMALPHTQRKAALSDPGVRKRMNDGMHAPSAGAYGSLSNWSEWQIVETFRPENASLNGTLIGALASKLNKAPLDTLLDLAIAEDLATRFMPKPSGADEESWKMRAKAWRDPRALIGASDAGAHLDMIDTFAFSSHVLSEGVRERRIMPIEEAVHRMTGLPAAVFGLKDRGTLNEGKCADLVIFDPETVCAGPIYSRADLPGGQARLYCDAIGIRDVIVNGMPIIRNAEFTGDMPGHILRSGKDTVSVPIS